jgi:hypothetical protein
MTIYRKGVENIPLKEINKHLPILVIIYDLQNEDKVLEEKRINYGDVEDRKWLGRISFWAYQNHCSVETIAIQDADQPYVQS